MAVTKEVVHHDGFEIPSFEESLEFVNIVCGWILLGSVAIALFNASLLLVQHVTGRKLKMFLAVTQPPGCAVTLDRIKLELGRLLAFSLLLLVAADVIETLMKPMHDLTMDDLNKMAMVGAIRTALAFFLGKELEEIVHHIKHEEEHAASHGGTPEEGKAGEKKKTH